jgi:hypothetical protein
MNFITYVGSVPSQNIPSTLYGVFETDQLSSFGITSTLSELYKKHITRLPIENASVYWNPSSIQFVSSAMQSTVDGLVSSQNTLVIPVKLTGYMDSLHPSSSLLGSNTLASSCMVGSKIQVHKSPGMPVISSMYFQLRLNVQ